MLVPLGTEVPSTWFVAAQSTVRLPLGAFVALKLLAVKLGSVPVGFRLWKVKILGFQLIEYSVLVNWLKFSTVISMQTVENGPP